MTLPLFSVLIANYNNGHFLEEALNSVYKQTYTNWEIIIVDDFSTDNSKDIYKQLESNSKIRIFKNAKNKGAGYTKKRCVDEANGEICGFLDPDDALDENALRKMVNAHVDNPKVALVHSKAYYCDENLKVTSQNYTSRQLDQNNPLFFNLESLISHFTSFKISFYQKTEGIDSIVRRAVDQDLYLKLYEVGNTLFMDEFLYYYRIHDSGISTTSNVYKAFYWHWCVINNAAKRRNVNAEHLFEEYIVLKREHDELDKKYQRLKRYEKLHNILARLRKKLN